jgi:hypothetical protein
MERAVEVNVEFDLAAEIQTPIRVIEEDIVATRQTINECEKQIFAYQDKVAVAQQKLAILVELREKIDFKVELHELAMNRLHSEA